MDTGAPLATRPPTKHAVAHTPIRVGTEATTNSALLEISTCAWVFTFVLVWFFIFLSQ